MPQDGLKEADLKCGVARDSSAMEASAGSGPRAGPRVAQGVAAGAHLEALGDGREAELRGHVLPYHSMKGALISKMRSQSMQTTWAICVFCSRVRHVELLSAADVDLPQERALGHDGKRPVDGGAGHGVVDRPA
jgi:hypothetical protein